MLYIFWFLHQTTTYHYCICFIFVLYIFWFLHQTTTGAVLIWKDTRCISFDSYIKPQRRANNQARSRCCISFDSYIKPQPNIRQKIKPKSCISFDSYIKPQLLWCSDFRSKVVYLLIPTSNHNNEKMIDDKLKVVYLLIPTSNHNWKRK